LNWADATAGEGCNVTYPVYEDGSSTPIATVDSPTYGLPALSPGAYTFTVAASDSSGISAPSTAVGIFTVTITGTAVATPPDAGQSTQVVLVVN
jgi:hypothetical protein